MSHKCHDANIQEHRCRCRVRKRFSIGQIDAYQTGYAEVAVMLSKIFIVFFIVKFPLRPESLNARYENISHKSLDGSLHLLKVYVSFGFFFYFIANRTSSRVNIIYASPYRFFYRRRPIRTSDERTSVGVGKNFANLRRLCRVETVLLTCQYKGDNVSLGSESFQNIR